MNNFSLPQELMDLIFEFIEKDFCFNENYGFISTITSPKQRLIQKEKNEKQFKIWISLFQKGFFQKKMDNKIRKMCYEGIPPRLRGILWSHFLNTTKYKKEGIYQQLLQKNPKDIGVEKDVSRTHVDTLFHKQKQKELKNILNAYLEYFPNVKYSSGMNWIASTLLFNMSEEMAFWALVSLFHTPVYNDAFQKQTGAWNKELDVFETLMKQFVPKLVNKFEMSSIANLWILTSFSFGFQPEISCRVFDVFCFEGFNSIHRVAIALMVLLEKEMLSQSWEDLLIYISRIIPLNFFKADELMNKTFSMNISDSLIEKIRKESK
jgi:TBC1 domain family member 14